MANHLGGKIKTINRIINNKTIRSLWNTPFNIDRAQSYFLGDKDIDMELAKNANLKGIHIPNDFKNVLLFSLSLK